MKLKEWVSLWQEKYDRPSVRPSSFKAHGYVLKNHILPLLGEFAQYDAPTSQPRAEEGRPAAYPIYGPAALVCSTGDEVWQDDANHRRRIGLHTHQFCGKKLQRVLTPGSKEKPPRGRLRRCTGRTTKGSGYVGKLDRLIKDGSLHIRFE